MDKSPIPPLDFSNLRAVDFSNCATLTDAVLLTLPSGLRAATLDGCRALTDAGLVMFFRTQRALRGISASNLPSLKDSSLPFISSLPFLSRLSLSCCSALTPALLQRTLASANLIDTLSLSNSISVTKDVVVAAAAIPSLTALDVSTLACVDEGVCDAIAASCKHLVSLRIGGAGIDVGRGIAAVVEKCAMVTQLDVVAHSTNVPHFEGGLWR